MPEWREAEKEIKCGKMEGGRGTGNLAKWRDVEKIRKLGVSILKKNESIIPVCNAEKQKSR